MSRYYMVQTTEMVKLANGLNIAFNWHRETGYPSGVACDLVSKKTYVDGCPGSCHVAVPLNPNVVTSFDFDHPIVPKLVDLRFRMKENQRKYEVWKRSVGAISSEEVHMDLSATLIFAKSVPHVMWNRISEALLRAVQKGDVEKARGYTVRLIECRWVIDGKESIETSYIVCPFCTQDEMLFCPSEQGGVRFVMHL